MTDQPKQIDITDSAVTIAELYKLALGEQKNVTALFAQLQQAQANVAAIEAEIAKREQNRIQKLQENLDIIDAKLDKLEKE